MVVRWLADRVNWLAVVDDRLPWDRDRARIAPNVILLMLVINVRIYSWDQTPVHSVMQRSVQHCVDVSYGPGTQAPGLSQIGIELLNLQRCGDF